MKRIFLLLGCGMLAAGMALAQDTGSEHPDQGAVQHHTRQYGSRLPQWIGRELHRHRREWHPVSSDWR